MPAQVASPSAPPFLADSLSHFDLRRAGDLPVGEKTVKYDNGVVKFVPFFCLRSRPSLISPFFSQKSKTCSTHSPLTGDLRRFVEWNEVSFDFLIF